MHKNDVPKAKKVLKKLTVGKGKGKGKSKGRKTGSKGGTPTDFNKPAVEWTDANTPC